MILLYLLILFTLFKLVLKNLMLNTKLTLKLNNIKLSTQFEQFNPLVLSEELFYVSYINFTIKIYDGCHALILYISKYLCI